MKTVNIADLKNRLSQYLREVKAGKEILIRDRNLPALAAEGRIRLAETTLDDSFWKLPAPRVSARALKRAIAMERYDR